MQDKILHVINMEFSPDFFDKFLRKFLSQEYTEGNV